MQYDSVIVSQICSFLSLSILSEIVFLLVEKFEKFRISVKLKREETIKDDLSATKSLGHTVVIIGGTVVIVIPWQSYGQPGISWAL